MSEAFLPKDASRLGVAPVAPRVVPQSPHDKIESLTRVRGVVGDIVEWIVAGARRPNRVMALGAALTVVGTLIGRRIMGPTESATHLYVIILAPTGYGKDHPLQAGAALMNAVGAGDLLGPQEWASAPGVLNSLTDHPVQVCFMDELGDELSLVVNQKGNEFVTKIIGTLKKGWNAWTILITAERASKKSQKIVWPAPSIVGAGTPQKFFENLRPGDLESGFANRLLILPFEGRRRPPERSPAPGALKPPPALIAALKALYKPTPLLESPILDKPDDKITDLRERMGWGVGAEEIYLAFSARLDHLEDGAKSRYELSMRACENAVRLATIVAAGKGSRTVDREDIEWAIALSEQSFEAAVGGFDRYMQEYLEFPKLCERFCDLFQGHGGRRKLRDLRRDFRRYMRYGNEYDKVLAHLSAEGRVVIEKIATGQRGPGTDWAVLIEGEGT